MKSTLEQLTLNERKALAHWYNTDSYKAYKKLSELERLNLATKLVDVDPTDVATIARHQGRADAYKQIHLVLRENYKKNQDN